MAVVTDEHYRAINRAVVLVEDQDIREAARTALHHIFGRENRLREALEKIDRGKKPSVGWQPIVPEVSLTKKDMQNIARATIAKVEGEMP